MKRIVLKHISGSKANQVEEFPLHLLSEITIGRDPSSTVKYDSTRDDLVGRQHAKIAADPANNTQFVLNDLNSRNGTFVNKQRVTGTVKLTPGDVVQFGAGGPEFIFDLDPRPENFVAATREASVNASVNVIGATREAASFNQPLSGVATQPMVGNQASAAAVSAPANGFGSGSNATAKGIGKATLERVVQQTKSDSRKMLYVSVAALLVVTALALGGITWWAKRKQDEQSQNIASQKKIIDAQRSDLDVVKNKPKENIAADIAQKHSNSVVQIIMGWSLIHTPTSEKVYQQFVPNVYQAADGSKRRIMENGPDYLPAFVMVENEVEPVLGVNKTSLPIAGGGSGTGFVVSKDGLIVTNKHVAASWRSFYGYPPNTFPAALFASDGKPVMNNGVPVIINNAMELPTYWTPSETKQVVKGIVGRPSLEGKNELLNVIFAKTQQPFKAEVAGISDQHDVATIKVTVGSNLPALEINDNYDTVKQGDSVFVLGFPGVSKDPKKLINDYALSGGTSVAVIPDPTLTIGHITKVIRGKEALGDKKIYAGDQYQLDIVSTGHGNSGGPVFDEQGKVVGIYYAGFNIPGDAAMSFAVPIRFVQSLIGPQQVIK
jgi:S1-C subfamily serine protease